MNEKTIKILKLVGILGGIFFLINIFGYFNPQNKGYSGFVKNEIAEDSSGTFPSSPSEKIGSNIRTEAMPAQNFAKGTDEGFNIVDKNIIKNADLNLRVGKTENAVDKITKIVKNQEGEITDINTYVTNKITDDADGNISGNYFGYDSENFSLDYKITGMAYNNLRDRYGEMYTASSDTVLIIIPRDPTNLDEKKYRVGNKSLTVTNQEIYPNIEVYDSDENYNIGVLIISDDNAGGAGDTILPSETRWVIEGFGSALNEEGMTVTNLRLQNWVGQRERRSFNLENDEIVFDNTWDINKTVKDLAIGDIIMFTRNDNGDINNIAVLFNAKGLKRPGQNKEKYMAKDVLHKNGAGVRVHAELYIAFQKVQKKSTNTIVLKKTNDEITSFNLRGSNVFLINMESKRVEKAAASDIQVGDEVFITCVWQNLSSILIYR
ncbi:MAG: hypothetical protein EOM23_07605 [Candidatus Moranbacteria bacterium]|nr:hypothetical protein [Candidatus Moranbacteria bacterium]